MTRDHATGSDVEEYLTGSDVTLSWTGSDATISWTGSELTGSGDQGSVVSDAPSPGVHIAGLAGCATIGQVRPRLFGRIGTDILLCYRMTV